MATAGAPTRTEWRIIGEEVVSCDRSCGCPCQFNAIPTAGFCEAFGGIDIKSGHFGVTTLEGVRFAQVFHWDGAVHEGDGWRRLIPDEKSTPEEREAVIAMTSETQGHPVFEIFSSMAPSVLEPVAAPIELEYNREKREGRIRFSGIAGTRIEPIKNPVTGEEHRARINVPNGFEYKVAEVGNSVHWRTDAGEKLAMEHEHTYAQLARIDWSSDGTTQ